MSKAKGGRSKQMDRNRIMGNTGIPGTQGYQERGTDNVLLYYAIKWSKVQGQERGNGNGDNDEVKSAEFLGVPGVTLRVTVPPS